MFLPKAESRKPKAENRKRKGVSQPALADIYRLDSRSRRKLPPCVGEHLFTSSETRQHLYPPAVVEAFGYGHRRDHVAVDLEHDAFSVGARDGFARKRQRLVDRLQGDASRRIHAGEKRALRVVDPNLDLEMPI